MSPNPYKYCICSAACTPYYFCPGFYLHQFRVLYRPVEIFQHPRHNQNCLCSFYKLSCLTFFTLCNGLGLRILPLSTMPLSVLIIDFLLLGIMLSSTRLFWRIWFERNQRKLSKNDGLTIKVLILGANETGNELIKHLNNNYPHYVHKWVHRQ